MSINYINIDDYKDNANYSDTYKGYKIRPFEDMFKLLIGFHLYKDNILIPHIFNSLEEVEKYVNAFG